jgi:flagellar basal body rod protein FlgG
MNIGLYQSASALSALERWQDSVAQNITSSQVPGFRKRTVNVLSQPGGELHTSRGSKIGSESGLPLSFPTVSHGINFVTGETQPTRREFDIAIQGDGFFEVKRHDGSKAYTRNGEFNLRADRTLVTAAGEEVLGDGGASITFVPGGGKVTINRDGTIFQGDTSVGRISVQRFANTAGLIPVAGGFFVPGGGVQPERVDEPELMQGYLEGSNVTALREMVDLVLISRAYEANQKIIKTMDDQMSRTLEALG